jgi:putative transposase
MSWIGKVQGVSVGRQYALTGVARSSLHAQQGPKVVDKEDLRISQLIDEQYTKRPFFGTRRMKTFLRRGGEPIGRKRLQRLMRLMGLAGMSPGPHTSKPGPGHRIYPYLLRGVLVAKPNQVWSTDITYIRLTQGFVYLVAVIDWYSRQVLSWRISNTMEASFCIACLEDALILYGKPEVFNSDQGAQFTSDAFTDVLKREAISISMDGRGRVFDNIFVERLWRSVKYEDIYLQSYSDTKELKHGLKKYFDFYNEERPHQALSDRTPQEVYESDQGGGALILQKYPVRLKL